jgi:molybdopterin-binding protein
MAKVKGQVKIKVKGQVKSQVKIKVGHIPNGWWLALDA